MTNTLSTLSAEAKQYYDRLMLERALPILAMYKAAQQRNIPPNSGNQVSYRRLNTLTAATTPLTEGVTPSKTALSITEITGTVQQYGNYVEVSDTLDMMGIDPIIREATMLLAENAAVSVEEIVRAELVTGTNVMFATGAARNAQGPSNPITLALVRRAVRTLEANDAPPFFGSRSDENGQGGTYIGFIHPRQWFDLVGDSAVLNTFTYSDPEKLYTMHLPMLGGVAWVKTTRAPIFTGAGASGANVFGAIICGSNAFGVVNVAGSGKFQVFAKPLGSGGTADPLDQRATIGWKSLQLPRILNNNFMVRIETGVSD
jgi:N4-gp56 family major capsid protein